MKKVFAFLLAIVFAFSAMASNTVLSPSVELPTPNANAIMLPVGKTGKVISLMKLSTISIDEFQALSGKKLSAFDRMGFKLSQKKLKHSLNEDGTIKSKSLKKMAAKMSAGGETGFHLGGFALGFFVGLIGVLIAYLINDDYKRNRVKWAWIGFGAYVALVVVVVIATLNSAGY